MKLKRQNQKWKKYPSTAFIFLLWIYCPETYPLSVALHSPSQFLPRTSFLPFNSFHSFFVLITSQFGVVVMKHSTCKFLDSQKTENSIKKVERCISLLFSILNAIVFVLSFPILWKWFFVWSLPEMIALWHYFLPNDNFIEYLFIEYRIRNDTVEGTENGLQCKFYSKYWYWRFDFESGLCISYRRKTLKWNESLEKDAEWIINLCIKIG